MPSEEPCKAFLLSNTRKSSQRDKVYSGNVYVCEGFYNTKVCVRTLKKMLCSFDKVCSINKLL